MSDWLSLQSLSSHAQSQDGACAAYIKGTACALGLCVRLASLALVLCASLSLRASLALGRCAPLVTVPALSARHLSPCSRPSSSRRLFSLASPLARLSPPLSASGGRCAQHLSRPLSSLLASPRLGSRLPCPWLVLVSPLCLSSAPSLFLASRLVLRPSSPNNIQAEK